MFTGIVEEIGTVLFVEQGVHSLQIGIRCHTILEDIAIGHSIAVNGVCLTVSHFTSKHFTADVMPETMNATTLHDLKQGSVVNLERAMAANGRFGGHIVSGHVDTTGDIIAIRNVDNAKYIDIQIPSNWLHYFIEKGSVTVDGTSLTVFGVTKSSITISLIPVTQGDSIVGQKRIGEKVNIECDMIAKYIERLLQKRDQPIIKESITLDTLMKNGFID